MEDKVGAALVVGAGISGMQSALDLAESGFKVYLLDKSPAIGGTMAQLDKTFPTNDCAMCIMAPKLVEVGRHPNIELLTYSTLKELKGEAGNFNVKIKKQNRYVNLEKCTGCSECESVCPVEISSEFDENLSIRHAIYRKYPQAIPNAYTIQKSGISPCRATCPAGINGQGYIALTAAGKFKEALGVVKEKTPFPAVLGRICHHPCESECNRGDLDEPISICEIKRFLADYAYENGTEETPDIEDKNEGKVAIIGSGPSGLTAANNLARNGYQVTVFEALPVAGGMLAVGIPDYRLPRDVLNREIHAIKALGVDIKLNTPIGKDLTIQDLFAQGYKAIYIATGAHISSKLGIEGEDLQGVYHGVDFLRDVALGKNPIIGNKVAVIGGGNVAIDSARTAARMGAEAFIIYRRSKEEMPANRWEIEEAEEEGIEIDFLATPTKILGSDGEVTGIECIKMKLGEPDDSGRRRPEPIPGSEFTLDVDTVIPSIGQLPNTSFIDELTNIDMTKRGTFLVDPNSLMTSADGVFAGGDNVSGPASAIEAIAHGNKVAEAISKYIKGEDPAVDSKLLEEIVTYDDLTLKPNDKVIIEREKPTYLPATERINNFQEVITKAFTEQQARAEANRCLNCAVCSGCMQCLTVCKAEAIDHDMKEKDIEINVGSIILSPGFDEFDPNLITQYGYGIYPNVVTSIEFERILSASGPFAGHVKRLSDGEVPKKIAFIQCIGSRGRPPSKPYCSSVCCMYAIKEATIAKEHCPGLETTIFFMDMRAYGKEFDDYYIRAEKEHKIRFVRNNRISTITEDRNTHNLFIPYIEEGELRNEEFDLVVLSVGITAPKDAKELSDILDIELNQFDFCAKNSLFAPLETSRPGIYVAGSFNAPKDIPDCVSESSGAAAKASSYISSERGKSISIKKYPKEKEITGVEPRIGVFVCHCGINIGGVVDVPEVVEYAKVLPNVVYSEDNLYTCSDDTQNAIANKIKEYNLNRVVVASCTPRTHQPLFQNTLREAGLNPYLFEMANIRDQCSWVHMREPSRATGKAKDLVRIAVAKSALLEPLNRIPINVNPVGLVIGGGLTGITAALELSKQGFRSYLIEKEAELGGLMRRIKYEMDYERGLEKKDIQEKMKGMIDEIKADKNIELFTESSVKEISGFIGNFKSVIEANGNEKEIEHGIIILATGGDEYRPKEYFYGEADNVLTQLELEEKLINEEKLDARSIVMIQCVGSRNDERPYCSRVCCTEAMKNAIKIKELDPNCEIYVLFRDIRTYGFRELLYEKAARMGVKFIRYNEEYMPRVTYNDGSGIDVTIREHFINHDISIKPDLLVLSVATVPHKENLELAKMLKVPLSKDKLFLEAHMKLRPVEFATDGIYLCGLAHSPKFFEECVAQANAAVSRALTIISKDKLESEAMVAVVDLDKCCGCRTCEGICPFNAQQVTKQEVGWKAETIPAACKGCGSCATACPENAITMLNFTDDLLVSAGIAALREIEGIETTAQLDKDKNISSNVPEEMS